MSMQFLLMERERKYIKNMFEWEDRTEDSKHASELLDDEKPVDPEEEPEI